MSADAPSAPAKQLKRPAEHPGERSEEDGWVRIDTPIVKFTYKPETRSPISRYREHDNYRSALSLLENLARSEISRLEICTVAILAHEQLVYAKTWKQSRGLLLNSKSAPVEELKKLRRIALKYSWDVYFDAFRKSSFFVKNLLAEMCGDFIYPASAALDAEVLVKTVDRALAETRIRARPRELELDRCASLLISAFERFTGKEARLANDSSNGRPTSALHHFVRDYGAIYGIKIVTDASDGRLEKMLENRAEFSGDLCTIAWRGAAHHGYAVYVYTPDLFSM